MFTVLELSSRYPEEGGLYAWTRRAFGEFPGYLSGYLYWSSNLPYFPSLFYFTAANALFIFGHRFECAAEQPAVLHHLLDDRAGGRGRAQRHRPEDRKVAAQPRRHRTVDSGHRARGDGDRRRRAVGSATPFTARSFVPSTHLKDIIFWSTIAFSLSGLESASMLGDEIEDARRNIPRALLIAGVLITILYIAATVAMMLALPPKEIQNMQGIMHAITLVATRLGIPWIAVGIALLITVGGFGQAGAWFAAAGRLPFVIGIDQPPSARVREDPSEVGNPVHRAAGAGGDRGRVHLCGAGGDISDRRLQRAREHVRDRVSSFHTCSCSRP